MAKVLENAIEGNKSNFLAAIENDLIQSKRRLVITVNSEHVSEKSLFKSDVLSDEEIYFVLDGVGVKSVSSLLGYKDKLRYPGVEIIEDLLPIMNKNKLNLAVIGAAPDSLEQFLNKIALNYPNINISFSSNGYITDFKKDEYMKALPGYQADLILIGLGVPKQEKIILKHFKNFDKGVFIGCGGSIDVIGGYKKRAPSFFRHTHTEWLYRLINEPNRIPRFIKSNIKLFGELLNAK